MTLAPFATLSQLQERLDDVDPVKGQRALEDASAHLRDDVIGAQVWPVAVMTYTVQASGEAGLWLPPGPVTVLSATLVPHGGASTPVALDLLHVDDHGRLARAHGLLWCGPVTLTVQVGYATPPDGLVRWTLVLAAQQLAMGDAALLGSTSGGTVAVDDFRTAWSGPVGGVPAAAADQLRRTFGSTVTVT